MRLTNLERFECRTPNEPEDPTLTGMPVLKAQYKTDNVRKGHRELINYDHVSAHFIIFISLLDVRTEYYYRYEVPKPYLPANGRFKANSNRGNTNHRRYERSDACGATSD
jgi:hypothetical protein